MTVDTAQTIVAFVAATVGAFGGWWARGLLNAPRESVDERHAQWAAVLPFHSSGRHHLPEPGQIEHTCALPEYKLKKRKKEVAK